MSQNNKPDCRGCRHLRYRPTLAADPQKILPAWSAPGTYICDVFGTIGEATHVPIPRTETCKDGS